MLSIEADHALLHAVYKAVHAVYRRQGMQSIGGSACSL